MSGQDVVIARLARALVSTVFLCCVVFRASSSLAQTELPHGPGSKPPSFWVYVGTYTNDAKSGGSEGIYLLELDSHTGILSAPRLAAKAINPSFLAVHPGRRFLYSVNEVDKFEGREGGGITAFAIDQAQGTLAPLNHESTVGAGPCHLVVDQSGKNVLVANYGGGSIACLPLGVDGRLGTATSFIQHRGAGANRQRQGSPHAHSINLDAGNHFAVVADLGLDKVFVYRFDPGSGGLTPNEPAFAEVAPGSGPRHFAFHPGGRFGYVINELASTVTTFVYDAAKGSLTKLQAISTLPAGFQGASYTAEVQVHPSGKFLYGSNRGHDTIAIFAIEPQTGKLSTLAFEPTRGKNPRNFAIDPTGTFLLAENQDSSTIVMFRIDPQTGTLRPTGQSALLSKPVCIKMIPKAR